MLLHYRKNRAKKLNIVVEPSQRCGKLHFGYLVVAALVLTSFIPLSLGLSCAGIFYPEVSSDLGVGKGLLSYYTSILWLSAMVFLPLMGRLFNEHDARLCLTGAVTIIAVAFIWLSFTRSLWQFYAGAFAMGIGVGMLLFLAPSTLINRWFAKRCGFLLGIVMAFTGVGGVVWSTVGGALIHAVGWSTTYLIFAMLSAATIPATLLMVSSHPRDKGLQPYGYQPNSVDSSGQAALEGIGASEAFKMPVFFLLLAMCLLLNFGMYIYFMIPSYISTLPLAIGMPLLGATASSVAMAGQTVSKLVLGYVGDKQPHLSTLAGIVLGMGGVIMLFLGSETAILIYVAAFIYGVFYGITNVMTPILTRNSFGNKDYPKIYSRVSMAASIGSMASGFIWGALIDVTGSFTVMFVGVTAIMAVTGLIVLLIQKYQRP